MVYSFGDEMYRWTRASLVVAASGVGTDVGRIERELLASQAAVSKALVELVHAQQV